MVGCTRIQQIEEARPENDGRRRFGQPQVDRRPVGGRRLIPPG
jgi:hypothetical protein